MHVFDVSCLLLLRDLGCWCLLNLFGNGFEVVVGRLIIGKLELRCGLRSL